MRVEFFEMLLKSDLKVANKVSFPFQFPTNIWVRKCPIQTYIQPNVVIYLIYWNTILLCKICPFVCIYI